MYVYRYAASVGVKLMTFDTAFELQKIAQLYPSTGESASGLCCPSSGNRTCSRNFLRKIRELLLLVAELLLRIRADDPSARCCLGNKYGCEPAAAAQLLRAAADLRLKVTGVSFHVVSCYKTVG